MTHAQVNEIVNEDGEEDPTQGPPLCRQNYAGLLRSNVSVCIKSTYYAHAFLYYLQT